MKWQSRLSYLLIRRSPLAWMMDRITLRLAFFLLFNWLVARWLGEWYGGVAVVALAMTLLLHWPMAAWEKNRLEKRASRIMEQKEREWLKERLSRSPELWPQFLAKGWGEGNWTRLRKGEFRRDDQEQKTLFRVVTGPVTLEEGEDFLAVLEEKECDQGVLLSLDGHESSLQRLMNGSEGRLRVVSGKELLDRFIDSGAGPEEREIYDWLNKDRIRLVLDRQTWKERILQLKPKQLLITSFLLVFLAPMAGQWAPVYWTAALLQLAMVLFLYGYGRLSRYR